MPFRRSRGRRSFRRRGRAGRRRSFSGRRRSRGRVARRLRVGIRM